MSFRYDINSLRAFSILSVLGFHFYPNIVPGGFIGVDIFFVLSGFLMTKIITTKLDDKSFDLFSFYSARINRIIPVYSIFLIVIGVTGFLYISPWDFKTVGRDIATSSIFLSNVMFSMRSGYFEVTDNFLLHTWSLSVEWQFYLIFPLVLCCIARQTRFSRLSFLLALFTISVVLNCYYQFFQLNEAYFLLWTRAWELISGALVYEIGKNKKSRTGKISNIIQNLSWLTLFSTVVVIDKNYFWPGLITLIPILATCSIIYIDGHCVIYNNKLVKCFGLSSYSIYLWHWPLAVLVSYYGLDSGYSFKLLVLAVFVGLASYYFIELQLGKFRTKKSALFWVVIPFLIALGGSIVFYTGGFASRVNLVSNSLVQGGMDDTFKLREGVHYYNSSDRNLLVLSYW
ncbi:acyltransferase family protein [Vibrio cyclitrophicus]